MSYTAAGHQEANVCELSCHRLFVVFIGSFGSFSTTEPLIHDMMSSNLI